MATVPYRPIAVQGSAMKVQLSNCVDDSRDNQYAKLVFKPTDSNGVAAFTLANQDSDVDTEDVVQFCKSAPQHATLRPWLYPKVASKQRMSAQTEAPCLRRYHSCGDVVTAGTVSDFKAPLT